MKRDNNIEFNNDYGHGAKVPVDLDKDIKRLEAYLEVNVAASRTPTYFAFGGLGLILLGMALKIFIILGIVCEVIGLILAMRKKYTIAYKWNRSIVMYLKNNMKESSDYLERLPIEEKKTSSYTKMRNLLDMKKPTF